MFRFQDGVTLAQIRRMFIKYVTDHPEVENQSATKVLVTATRPVVEYLLLDKNAKAKPGTVWKSNALKNGSAVMVLAQHPLQFPLQHKFRHRH